MIPHYTDDAVTLYAGDCLDVLRELPDASVDAVVTDPPYALNFMGRSWDRFDTGDAAVICEECGNDDAAEGMRLCLDCLEAADAADLRGSAMLGHQSQNWHAKATHSRGYADNNNAAFQRWCRLWATECLRVLRPGGHMLAFGGTRTWHRLACAIEDAGFEVRDSIAWLYGSGFPKSLDVSKAIDRAAGAEREVVGTRPQAPKFNLATAGGANTGYNRRLDEGASAEFDITAPATDDARTWQGWGTALKPAFEPVVVARKPLDGTVAATVLRHGTGAFNVDGCRIGTTDDLNGGAYAASSTKRAEDASGYALGVAGDTFTPPAGRWPANVVLDESQAAELDRQSGEVSYNPPATWRGGTDSTEGWGSIGNAEPGQVRSGFGDRGGASRFFYVAKAPTAERPREDGIAHPTVKPLDLMRWLVRLVTPPGGVVLEPFAGSGTTAEACVIEGFRCIAIEREADYLPLIVQRLTKPIQPTLFGGDDAA